MWRRVLMGTAAGAVGTVALDMATYADMAIRGRSPSNVPAELVGVIAGKVGLESLDMQGPSKDDPKAQHRRSGLGALAGYATGLGVGTLYGMLRLGVREMPLPLATVVLGAGAMAGSDVPITVLGVSDPRTWGTSGWLADIIPHLIYGAFTAGAYEAFTRDE